MSSQPHCVFCGSTGSKPSNYPTYLFNDKNFKYVKCTKCGLIYLDPLPQIDDYIKMYPATYHKNMLDTRILENPEEMLWGLRFTYKYQFDLINKIAGKGATLLDYGCGAANFLVNANHYGFACDGAEFDPDYVNYLAAAIPQSNFFVINDILENKVSKKYDVIRLSNVLEHIDKPAEVLKKIATLLQPDGILLIEGPLENNRYLIQYIYRLYFFIKKRMSSNYTSTAPPYHIFFSNYKNQKDFFVNNGFQLVQFDVRENPWPMPETVKGAKGIKRKGMALAAQISIYTGKIISKKWGNAFIAAIKLN